MFSCTEFFESFITDATHIEKLEAWYDARWEEASEVRAELLRTIERHLRQYPPFTVAEIDEVLDNVEEIWPEVRCSEDTMRWTEDGPGGLTDARKQIEGHCLTIPSL